jgi:hypothetical protein
MNKKLALFLLALGIGAASAPAYAYSCGYYCTVYYRLCLNKHLGEEKCAADREACFDRCAANEYPDDR